MTYGVQLEALTESAKMKMYNAVVYSNNNFKLTSSKNIQIYCVSKQTKKGLEYIYSSRVELNLEEDVHFFLRIKKKRNLPIKFHALKLCIDSKKFPPRLFLFDPEKRFDPGLKNVTGYNNANRDESTDTSQLKHPKIVCSTCNVRPYDVSRAG